MIAVLLPRGSGQRSQVSGMTPLRGRSGSPANLGCTPKRGFEYLGGMVPEGKTIMDIMRLTEAHPELMSLLPKEVAERISEP